VEARVAAARHSDRHRCREGTTAAKALGLDVRALTTAELCDELGRIGTLSRFSRLPLQGGMT
jgi:hypothetical protein